MSVRILSPRPALLLFAAFALVGCDESFNPVEPGQVVASVRIDAPSTSLALGTSMQLRAVAVAANGAELPDRSITWSTTTSEIVSVGNTGLVRALDVGQAAVFASAAGVSRRVDLSVVRVPVERIVLDATSLDLVEGDSIRIVAEVRDENDVVLPNRQLVWTSLTGSIASAVNGWVRGLRAGATFVQVSSGVATQMVEVTVRRELTGEMLLVSTDPTVGGPRIFRTDLRDEAVSIRPWQATGTSRHPRLSPDGTRVAYACPDTSTARGSTICIANLDGTGVRVLTGHDDFSEDEPSWSPDGRFIAYRRYAATFGWPGWTIPTDIWVTNVEGTQGTNLTADATSQHQPVWSPVPINGEYRIMYVEEQIVNNQRRTWLASMRPNGSDRRNETQPGERSDLSPAWSPDGATIVFTRAPLGGLPELFSLDRVTGVVGRFLPYELGGGQSSPAWSPDGAHLAFSSAHEPSTGGDWQVYTVRADGSRLVRRTSGGAGRSQLEWIPTP